MYQSIHLLAIPIVNAERAEITFVFFLVVVNIETILRLFQLIHFSAAITPLRSNSEREQDDSEKNLGDGDMHCLSFR
jgi:hypothetical protein